MYILYIFPVFRYWAPARAKSSEKLQNNTTNIIQVKYIADLVNISKKYLVV